MARSQVSHHPVGQQCGENHQDRGVEEWAGVTARIIILLHRERSGGLQLTYRFPSQQQVLAVVPAIVCFLHLFFCSLHKVSSPTIPISQVCVDTVYPSLESYNEIYDQHGIEIQKFIN